MNCPLIKTCEEYKNVRKYNYAEKKQCGWKDYWSKCPILVAAKKKET